MGVSAETATHCEYMHPVQLTRVCVRMSTLVLLVHTCTVSFSYSSAQDTQFGGRAVKYTTFVQTLYVCQGNLLNSQLTSDL